MSVDIKSLITRVQWVPWRTADDLFLEGATIIGRARIELERGGLIHALIVERGEDAQHLPVEDRLRAVYWNRADDAFESEPLTMGEAHPCRTIAR